MATASKMKAVIDEALKPNRLPASKSFNISHDRDDLLRFIATLIFTATCLSLIFSAIIAFSATIVIFHSFNNMRFLENASTVLKYSSAVAGISAMGMVLWLALIGIGKVGDKVVSK